MSSESEPSHSQQYLRATYTTDGQRRLDSDIAGPGGLLSKEPILRCIQEGRIIVNPLNEANIGGASIDVTMGSWIWRERKSDLGGPLGRIVDPWAEDAAEKLWVGPFQAKTAGETFNELWLPQSKLDQQSVSFSPDDRLFILAPGENILAHTQQFIGGDNSIATAMQARSSLGRSHFTVCRCAGWGDPGYVNRWTMEITNNSKERPLVLIVGRRVAQIVFWEVEPVGDGYGQDGKYQVGGDLEDLMTSWKPEDMLPKLFLDREIYVMAQRVAEPEERDYRASRDTGIRYAIPRLEEIDRYYSSEAAEQYYQFAALGLYPEQAQVVNRTICEEGLEALVFNPDPVS